MAQTFQHYIDFAQRDLPFTFVSIDDILNASKDNAEHIEHLGIVFQRLRKNRLTINREKSVFGLSSVQILGYEVYRTGIKPSPYKVSVISNFPKYSL